MPVPAPATAELLKGARCHYGRVDQETTTPTGAAILKTAVTHFAAPEHFITDRIGYGLGQKDFPMANVLRVQLGTMPAPAADTDENREVVCNIDDMNPEAFAPLLDALFAAGALDAYLTPVIMKKSRPGTVVTVLTSPALEATITDVLFAQSTTIGVRSRTVRKRMLPRETVTVTTALGRARAKVVTLGDGSRRWKAEHDDVARIAATTNRSYLHVRELVDAAVAELLNGKP